MRTLIITDSEGTSLLRVQVAKDGTTYLSRPADAFGGWEDPIGLWWDELQRIVRFAQEVRDEARAGAARSDR